MPLDFDAGKRAQALLNHTNITIAEEYPKANDTLKWAATNYIIAALAAVVTLVRYIYALPGEPG